MDRTDEAIANTGRVLQTLTFEREPAPVSEEDAITTASDDGSEDCVFTDSGLARALNRITFLPEPSQHTHQEFAEIRKDVQYIKHTTDRRSDLVSELDNAMTAFNEADELRQANEDPSKEDHINKIWYEAHNRLANADHEYRIFVNDMAELATMAEVSRGEIERTFTIKRTKASYDLRKQAEAHAQKVLWPTSYVTVTNARIEELKAEVQKGRENFGWAQNEINRHRRTAQEELMRRVEAQKELNWFIDQDGFYAGQALEQELEVEQLRRTIKAQADEIGVLRQKNEDLGKGQLIGPL